MEIVFGVDIPLLLLLLPLAILLLYWQGMRSYNFWSSRGIPGPKPQPFFGHEWQVQKKGIQKCLTEWSKAHGRVYGIYMNLKPMLVTNDLDILREVMVKDFPHFTDRFDRVQGGIFSKTVFFARGHDWKRIRNIISPTFTSGKLRLMESYINSCSEVFSKNIQEIARHGGKIIVKEYCGAFTMDVITGTVFGIVVNSQKDFQNEFVTNAKLLLQHGGAPRSFFRQLLTLTPFLNRLNQYLQNPFVKKEDPHGFLYKAIRRIVADRKEETVPRKKTDFVQLLINAETSEDFVGAVSENAKRLTPDEIVAQMVIFFIAGYETTATTLHFMIYNLAMYPDIQQKIVDEIQQQIGDEVPTNDNVSKLKYMEQTIKETLRLFPPVPAINRVASETVTIKGVTIPKGVGVLIPIYDVMRDPEYFPDPEVFRPERFSEEAKDEMNPALSWHSASDPACASASVWLCWK
ncbi:cytochrome P450 3A24-like [Pomacea canaliculata]|uniref:cytochrome P450 3A24-like n=1 Tax=Pomacea canaliculata TaxID=400727 RepID=UPI000D72AC3E|nr:cytochrome P450 3A24-like [Pomacea canaliculata]